MLSDEEKKALERIDYIQDFIIENGQYNADVNDMEYFSKILNLIEKQSKEIEELNRLKGFEMLDIFNMGKQSSRQRIEFDYVDKDKIKAKIEELEIEQESNREDLKIAIDNLLFQNIDKIGNKISINMSVRGILQSLLEKE